MHAEMCFWTYFKWVIYIKVNLLVKSCLRNEKKEYNIKGIYNDNIIKFIEDDIITLVNLKERTLERVNKQDIIKFNFKDSNCNIKNNNLNFNFKIEVLDLKVLDNYFYVLYKLEEDYYKLEINIEKNSMEELWRKN